MSAIIKEIYWQEYDTTTQIRTVRADIICDTIADLPSGGIMPDYKLDIGSRAKVIADGSEWEIQSSGSWVRQPSKLQLDLAGYATTQYVDTGLASKVDTSTYTAGQSAQDTVIAGKADVSKFDITLSSVITASEYSYSCIQTGDIVTVCFRIVLAAGLNANTSYTLFALPSDKYPRVTVAGTGYANSKWCLFWLNTGGQIRFTVGADAIPSGSNINANFCYSHKQTNWTTVTIP